MVPPPFPFSSHSKSTSHSFPSSPFPSLAFYVLTFLFLVTFASPRQSQVLGEDVSELVFPLGQTGGAVVRGVQEDRGSSRQVAAPVLAARVLEQPLTVCVWVKAALRTATARILSYFHGPVVIFVARSAAMITLRTESHYIDVEGVELSPREWHQLCVLRHPRTGVNLLLDGQVFSGIPYPANDTNLMERRQKNNKAIAKLIERAAEMAGQNFTNIPMIILGSVESAFDSPVGRMADLRVYGRILARQEMKKMRSCDTEENNGKRYLLEIVYQTEPSVLRNISSDSMCHVKTMNVLTYPSFNKQDDADGLCEKLGGQLPSPQNFDDLVATADILPQYSGKNEMYFWLSNSTNKMALGIDESWCIAQDLRYGGTIPMSAPCDSWARDFVCYVSRDKTVFLLHSDREVELFYGNVGENYLLLSDQGYSLASEKEYYVIRNMVGGLLLKRLGQQITDILGLKSWQLPSDSNYPITLSTCQRDEYTCSSGDCLALENRCNKWPDCIDASDEDDCHYLQPPPATYRAFLSPTNSTPVGLSVVITDIHDINMKENQLSISLNVSLFWTDARLTFTNMHQERTRLDEALGRVWQPVIVFAEAKYEDNVNLQKGINDMRFLYAKSSYLGVQAVFNSSRALKQDGSQVRLNLQLLLDLTLTCTYNLTLYPFDVQECGFTLNLGSSGTNWDSDGLTIVDSLPQPALYGASNVRLNKHSETKVVVRFLLERWFGSYMLTSYLPCLILLVIGTLTLAYPVDALSDRVMVTLSCLIVLASLLAQASATLPESSSSKAIEVWFFYTIARMFLVSVIHTAVYRANHKQEESLSILRVSPSSATLVNKGMMATEGKKLEGAWPPMPPMPPTKKNKRTNPERINRWGMILGLSLDVVFMAGYVTYVIMIRGASFARGD